MKKVTSDFRSTTEHAAEQETDPASRDDAQKIAEEEALFQRLLHDKLGIGEKGADAGSQTGKGSQDDKKRGAQGRHAAKLGAGDRILQGMQSSSVAGVPEAEELEPSRPVERVTHLAEIADKIAERILVSDKSVSAQSEVRIQLKESTLGGAEITVRHDQGRILVGIAVADPAVGNRIAGQTNELQRTLEQRLDQPVQVDINVQSGGSGSPGDGRSRNRRDPWEEWNQGQDDK